MANLRQPKKEWFSSGFHPGPNHVRTIWKSATMRANPYWMLTEPAQTRGVYAAHPRVSQKVYVRIGQSVGIVHSCSSLSTARAVSPVRVPPLPTAEKQSAGQKGQREKTKKQTARRPIAFTHTHPPNEESSLARRVPWTIHLHLSTFSCLIGAAFCDARNTSTYRDKTIYQSHPFGELP